MSSSSCLNSSDLNLNFFYSKFQTVTFQSLSGCLQTYSACNSQRPSAFWLISTNLSVWWRDWAQTINAGIENPLGDPRWYLCLIVDSLHHHHLSHVKKSSPLPSSPLSQRFTHLRSRGQEQNSAVMGVWSWQSFWGTQVLKKRARIWSEF